jgi:hypothetical protein
MRSNTDFFIGLLLDIYLGKDAHNGRSGFAVEVKKNKHKAYISGHVPCLRSHKNAGSSRKSACEQRQVPQGNDMIPFGALALS